MTISGTTQSPFGQSFPCVELTYATRTVAACTEETSYSHLIRGKFLIWSPFHCKILSLTHGLSVDFKGLPCVGYACYFNQELVHDGFPPDLIASCSDFACADCGTRRPPISSTAGTPVLPSAATCSIKAKMLRKVVDALLFAQNFDIGVLDVGGEPELRVADVQHVCFGAKFVFLAGELGILRVLFRIVLEIPRSIVELLYLVESVWRSRFLPGG